MARISIPGYTIERELGSGGMAKVYLAVQHSLERKVALKVMSPMLAADESFSKRFLREARTIAGLTHPNIVAIYEVGVTVDNLHFFAMQHLPGGDFGAKMRQGVAHEELCRVMTGIAKALGFAHERGFVHRDVTPANILFDPTENPVLTDFGIARALSGSTRITHTGVSIGTSLYMSPEQARGGDVDARSDLYSLGVLAFEALTGSTPYRGADSFAVAYAHVFEPIPRLPASCASWQGVIDRALAKDPRDRFKNAEEMCAALRSTMDARNGFPTQQLSAIAAPDSNGSAVESRGLVRPTAVTQLVEAMGQRLKRARVGPAALALRWAVPLLALLALVGLGYGGYRQFIAGPTNLDAPTPAPLTAAPQADSTTAIAAPTAAVEPVAVVQDYPLSYPALPEEGEQDPSSQERPLGPRSPATILAGWVSAGQAAVTDLRLTSPPGNSAVDYFGWVIEIQAQNEAAILGFESVVTRYMELAQLARDEKRYADIQEMLERARQVAMRHPQSTVQLQRIGELPNSWLTVLLGEAESALASWNPARAEAVLAEAALLVPDDPRISPMMVKAKAFARPGFKFRDSLQSGNRGPQMIVVAPGKVDLSGGRGASVSAAVARPFAVALHEVTLEDFIAYVNVSGQRPEGGCRSKEGTGLFGTTKGSRDWRSPDFVQSTKDPVVCVDFDDAQAYVRWLSRETGHVYRLLSEAEWQLLASKINASNPCASGNVADQRLGGRSAFSCDDGYEHTAPVGRFVATAAGPYDIDGNVREWVEDCANDSHTGHAGNQAARLSGDCSERMAMGRAWHSDKDEATVVQRKAFKTSVRSNTIGIRVAMTLPDGPPGQ